MSSSKVGVLLLSLFAGSILFSLHGEFAIATPGPGDFFTDEVRPVIDRRCTVCHACFNSPCQFNMASPEGIERGAHKVKILSNRYSAIEPTRLFIDEVTEAGWRRRGFFSVTESGALLTLLHLKNAQRTQSPGGFDFSRYIAEPSCPADGAEIREFVRGNPFAGMPLGFPKLTGAEFGTLIEWANRGYPGPSREERENVIEAIPDRESLQIEAWEEFLNGDSVKERVAARYLYEHLFLAHLYFDEELPERSTPSFFRLIRSKTPPGRDIETIATSRPMDDPRGKFYYRLQKITETIAHKVHVPFVLNAPKLARYRSLFLDIAWSVPDARIRFPSWERSVAYNPFVAFEQIPVASRYRFMLEDAYFFFSAFIRGPICRGESAANFIDDQFFVFFMNPDADPLVRSPTLYRRVKHDLVLPADSDERPLELTFDRFQMSRDRFLNAYYDHLSRSRRSGARLSDIWDGGGANPSRALTVFRHFDAASVHRGLLGPNPKTALVLDYAVFERIYYVFAAQYNVFGGIKHNLFSRKYADLLRREGEDLFLTFLPSNDRQSYRDLWYRGALASARTALTHPLRGLDRESRITFQAPSRQRGVERTKDQLFARLSDRLYPRGRGNFYARDLRGELEREMRRLGRTRGTYARWIPEVSFIRFTRPDGPPLHYSLMRNRGHYSVAFIALEALSSKPEEDYVQFERGFIGSYPRMFFDVPLRRVERFFSELQGVDSEESAGRWMRKYGTTRRNPSFWRIFDAFTEAYRAEEPVDFGILDLSRYEN